jgi:hypothetical protein
MQRAQRGTDWGVIIVILICLTAGWPFLFRGDVSDLNAQAAFATRAADYAESIREGRLYPRWSAHSVLGFGSPFPNFAPPLAPYASALLQLVITNNPVTAVRVLFLISLLGAGTSVYALVQRRSGSPRAVIAAALYVLSPMIFITTPHIIGDLSWSIAFALIPTLLWSIDRLSITRAPLDYALVVFVQCGLLLTHPPIALIGTALGTVYWLYLCLDGRAQWHTVPVIGSALILGLVLGSFFWLPALGEQQSVSWLEMRADDQPDRMAIVAATGGLDPAAAQPVPQLSPGTALWVSAFIVLIINLGTVLTGRRVHGLDFFWVFVSLVILAAWLILEHPPLWLPGLLSLSMALASPQMFALTRPSPAQRERLWFAITLTLILAAALPGGLFPQPGRSLSPEQTQPVERIRYEVSGLGNRLATTEQAIPISLRMPILADNRLINAYPDRMGTVFTLSRPVDALITPLIWTGHYRRYQIQARDAVQLTLPLAFFPGWYAELNGMYVELKRDPETGLVIIDLPALTFGELSIYFGTTPLRTLSWAISWLSLGVLLVITSRRLRHRYNTDEFIVTRQEWQLTRLMMLAAAAWLLLALVGGPILGLSIRPESGLSDYRRFTVTTRPGLEFLGYALPDAAAVVPGSALTVHLAWRAERPLSVDYVAHAFLLSLEDGRRWAFTAPEAPGDIAARRWPVGYYLIDPRVLYLPENLPAGEYAVGVEVFTCQPVCDPAQRLEFFQGETSLGRTLVLPQILAIIER